MKKKLKTAALILALTFLCTIPLKGQYKDGGTITYTAVLYKVISWHAYISAEAAGEPEGMYILTGTDVYLFPFNLAPFSYYYEKADKSNHIPAD